MRWMYNLRVFFFHFKTLLLKLQHCLINTRNSKREMWGYCGNNNEPLNVLEETWSGWGGRK
jgi:hypothetical protein